MAVTTQFDKYGVPVSLSVQRAVSSKYKKLIGMSYPLTRDLTATIVEGAQAGGFREYQKSTAQPIYFGAATGMELIKNNLRQLIMTEKGERVMLPDYGLSLSQYLFEPLDETVYHLVKTDILNNINKYFSIANVLKLTVYGNDQDRERHQLVISLTLQLLDESLDIFDIETRLG